MTDSANRPSADASRTDGATRHRRVLHRSFHPAETQPRRRRPSWLAALLMVLESVLMVAPLVLTDVVVNGGAVVATGSLGRALFGINGYVHFGNQLVVLLGAIGFVGTSLGLYTICGVHPVRELRRTVTTISVSFGILLIANMSFGRLGTYEAGLLTVAFLLAVCLGPAVRLTVRKLLGQCSWWGQAAVIVGDSEQAKKVAKRLNDMSSLGLKPVVPLSLGAGRRVDSAHTGSAPGPTFDVARRTPTWAIVPAAGMSEADVQATVARLAEEYPHVVVMRDPGGLPMLWASAEEFGGAIGLRVKERLLLPTHRIAKRGMDLALLAAGAVVVIPLSLCIGLLIKLCSPGPVFYSQSRVGKGGREFRAWKFRTMVVGADEILDEYLKRNPELRKEWDATQKLKHDPRIIPFVGQFLRKTSLDELPQLWNVLRGEMSLVGPRPFMPCQLEMYGEGFSLYRKMKPGVTGMWQISGRNFTTFQRRTEFDAYYIRNWSPWLDLYILYRTVRTVLLREGAY